MHTWPVNRTRTIFLANIAEAHSRSDTNDVIIILIMSSLIYSRPIGLFQEIKNGIEEAKNLTGEIKYLDFAYHTYI